MSKSRFRRLSVVATLLLVLAAGGHAFQRLSEDADLARHPPPGRWVDVGGYRLQLHCTGSGSPTVMLEAGLGNGITHWSALQPLLAVHTRVCSYDRAGLGWSDLGPLPRDADRIAAEFAALMGAADETAPVVLVGHSNGGLYARLFAYRQPHRVAGLVLLDPNHEDGPQCELPPAMRWSYGPLVQTAPLGLPRLLLPLLFPLQPTRLPDEAREAFAALRARSAALRTTWDELNQACSSYATLKAERRDLGELPLVLMSAGRRPAEVGDFIALHAALADSSRRGEHSVVEGAGHFLQLEVPERVAESVLRLVWQARAASTGDVHSEP